MALSRSYWDPFGEPTSLRDAMSRLFEESFVRPSGRWSGGSALPVDVCEEDDNYVIEVALPGLPPEAISVSVLGNQVGISGEYPNPPEGRQYLLRERAGGRFERTVTLPTAVDADKAEPNYEHGLLRLTIPKAESARPRRVAIGRPPAQRKDLPPAPETRL
jgi:HSP20 family protein